MFSCLDIFVLDTFLGTSDEPPQHYRKSDCTWNAYRLAVGLGTSSQQLAVTTQLTHNYCTFLLLRFGNFPRLCRTDTTEKGRKSIDRAHFSSSSYHSCTQLEFRLVASQGILISEGNSFLRNWTVLFSISFICSFPVRCVTDECDVYLFGAFFTEHQGYSRQWDYRQFWFELGLFMDNVSEFSYWERRKDMNFVTIISLGAEVLYATYQYQQVPILTTVILLLLYFKYLIRIDH
jgi:hypothetical protein